MGLYLYATGSQRQQLSVLSHLGITESYANLVAKDTRSKKQRKKDKADREAGRTPPPPKGGTLRQLSTSARTVSRTVASLGLFGTVYDNINFMSRNAEQIIGRHGMPLSNTFEFAVLTKSQTRKKMGHVQRSGHCSKLQHRSYSLQMLSKLLTPHAL